MEGMAEESVRHLANFIRGSRRGFSRASRRAKSETKREVSEMAEQI
jgi:hypothetical protein